MVRISDVVLLLVSCQNKDISRTLTDKRENNLAVYEMAMEASRKPCVWTHVLFAEDQKVGWIPEFEAMIREHFDLVTSHDLDANPNLGKDVQGVFLGGQMLGAYKSREALMPNVKVIANNGVGVNHLDVHGLATRGIRVANTPAVLSDSVADLAFALLLASARNIVSGAYDAMTNPDFNQMSQNDYGVDVHDSTLGIVGMGDIGFRIAQRAHGFNMKVLYHNRNPRSKSVEEEVGATYFGRLSDMLPQCDFVVIACSLTPDTEKLFGEAQFQLMSSQATLVNVSRGSIIDQESLLKALQDKWIRGAALDVTDPEPLPQNHPLLKQKNAIIIPHFGSATFRTRKLMTRLNVESMKAALIDNVPMPNEVKPQ